MHEKFGATAWNEHICVDADPQTAEFCPSQHVLERTPVDPLLYEVFQIGRATRRIAEQAGFVFREDTSGRPQACGQYFWDRTARNTADRRFGHMAP